MLKTRAILYNWKTADWKEVGFSLNNRPKPAEAYTTDRTSNSNWAYLKKNFSLKITYV